MNKRFLAAGMLLGCTLIFGGCTAGDNLYSESTTEEVMTSNESEENSTETSEVTKETTKETTQETTVEETTVYDCKISGHLYELLEEECVSVKCTYPGTDVYICRECGDKKEEMVYPKGHIWGEYLPYSDATCTSEALVFAQCSVEGCEATNTKKVKDSKRPHEAGEFVQDNNASCVSDATQRCYCVNCGELLAVEFVKGTKLAHSFTHYNYDNNVTCKTYGTKTAFCDYGCGTTDTASDTEHALSKHVLSDNGKCIYCGDNMEVCDDAQLINIATQKVEGFSHPGYYSCEAHRVSGYKELTGEKLQIPVVDIAGDLTYVTKLNTGSVTITFNGGGISFSEEATIKLQGGTSLGYPKKNYNIKFTNKVMVNALWGEQKKYCLKANYIDSTQARNVVSGKLYGQVVHSRGISDEVNALVNGGAIDGFPVVVYINNEFYGIYTLNIPKDKWLFGMKKSDEKNQAILFSNNNTASTMMQEPVASDYSNGWELEFASNEDSKTDNDTSWVVKSFNEFMNFVINSSDQEFKEGLSEYACVERCIDSYIFTLFMGGTDNFKKNMLWVTYDGKHWFNSVYDMDGTWGLSWDGSLTNDSTKRTFIFQTENLFLDRLNKVYHAEIIERYNELRLTFMTQDNIMAQFNAFAGQIPQMLADADAKRWPDVPSRAGNTINNISQWVKKHLELFDASAK